MTLDLHLSLCVVVLAPYGLDWFSIYGIHLGVGVCGWLCISSCCGGEGGDCGLWLGHMRIVFVLVPRFL